MFVSSPEDKQHLQPVAGPDSGSDVRLPDWWKRHSKEESSPPIGQHGSHQSRSAELLVFFPDVFIENKVSSCVCFYCSSVVVVRKKSHINMIKNNNNNCSTRFE